MKNYEKPIVLLNNEVAEGVYAASGVSDAGDTSGGCDSIYMNGIFSDGTPGGKTYKDKFGCTGCPAHTGKECKLDDPTYDPKGKVLKPNWERQGHLGQEDFKGNGKK